MEVTIDCKVVWGYEDVWVECLATRPNRLQLWGADASRRNGFGPSSTPAVPEVYEHIEGNNWGVCVTVKLIRRGLDAARRWGVLGLADGILRHATLNLFRVATEVHRVIQVGRAREG